MRKLDCLGIPYTEFREPDLDYNVTAIAVLDNMEIFKRLKLAGS